MNNTFRSILWTSSFSGSPLFILHPSSFGDTHELEPPAFLGYDAPFEHVSRTGRPNDSRIPQSIGAGARTTKPNERILVVIQLLGGNDGLNTVVPHGLDGYNRGRRALRISSAQIHKITPEIGLHPSLGGMAKLLEKGRLSVIQGVGYPNPDRSHFRSMEIWETAKLENDAKALETGWLGRALDSSARKPGEDPPGLHIGGRSLPMALRTRTTEVPSLDSLENYRLQVAGTDQEKRMTRTALSQLVEVDRRGDDPLLGFIRRSTLSAYESSDRLEQISRKPPGSKKYPNYDLARRLELIAKIIKADFGTRIFYTSHDGFDTHANQLGTHAALLTELSDSISAFHDDLGEARRGRSGRYVDIQRIRQAGPGKCFKWNRSWRGRAGLRGGSSRPAGIGWRSPQRRHARRR